MELFAPILSFINHAACSFGWAAESILWKIQLNLRPRLAGKTLFYSVKFGLLPAKSLRNANLRKNFGKKTLAAENQSGIPKGEADRMNLSYGQKVVLGPLQVCRRQTCINCRIEQLTAYKIHFPQRKRQQALESQNLKNPCGFLGWQP